MPSISQKRASSALTSPTISTKPIMTAALWLRGILSSASTSDANVFANPHEPPKLWPVDYGLTAAVAAFVDEKFTEAGSEPNPDTIHMPQWQIVPDRLSPKNLEDIEVDMLTGVLRVSEVNNSPTIWGSERDNAKFRVWHDYLHWTHHLPFTVAGEAACAYLHCWHLLQRYDHDVETEAWCALILTEVIGQALANTVQGSFPSDQRMFAISNADVYVALAGKLAVQLSRPGIMTSDAMYLAELAFGRP